MNESTTVTASDRPATVTFGESPALARSRHRSDDARVTHQQSQVQLERRHLAVVANEARIRAREQTICELRKRLEQDQAELKRLKQQRPALKEKLKAATKEVQRTARKARRFEKRYDEAVLRQVLEREKSIDRALHST